LLNVNTTVGHIGHIDVYMQHIYHVLVLMYEFFIKFL